VYNTDKVHSNKTKLYFNPADYAAMHMTYGDICILLMHMYLFHAHNIDAEVSKVISKKCIDNHVIFWIGVDIC